MKKVLAISLAAFVLMSGIRVPSASAATTDATSSEMFGKNLSFGLRNHPDVTSLQKFLTDQGFYAGPITGNFFSLTREAVKKFQASQGVSATGFFGPMSRGVANGIWKNVIGRVCMNGESCPWPLPAPDLSITTASDLHATVGQPFVAAFKVSGGDGPATYDIRGYDQAPGLSWTRTYCPDGMMCAQMATADTITLFGTPTKAGVFNAMVVAREINTVTCIRAEGCPAGSLAHYGRATFTIVVGGGSSGSGAPVIQGVKGPTTLNIGEEGIWTISASDPEGGSLSYSVTWGDESAAAGAANGAMPMMLQPFTQTATFSHAYRAAGTYTVNVRVADNTGAEAKASVTVLVRETAPQNPLSLFSLTPSSGFMGTAVTVKGQGFTPAGNVVYFGDGVAGANIASSDGATLVFAVPSSIDPMCRWSTPACMMASRIMVPGTYAVKVVNANGATSNSLSFTVNSSGY